MTALTGLLFKSRIQWMVSIGNELGGPAKAESMLQAKGVGFILQYIDCKYKRPVTFPDTVSFVFTFIAFTFDFTPTTSYSS
jgi:hypothetical protein